MVAAIDLGLFTAIAEGANTSKALAAKVGAAEQGARILADYLTIQGFLTKADGVYALTPSSATFLRLLGGRPRLRRAAGDQACCRSACWKSLSVGKPK